MTTTTTKIIPEWTFADRVRKAREHAGLSQADLAEAIGISRQTVSGWEAGTARRPLNVLMRLISDVTGVDHEWILHGDGERLPRLDSNQQPTDYMPDARGGGKYPRHWFDTPPPRRSRWKTEFRTSLPLEPIHVTDDPIAGRGVSSLKRLRS